MEANNDQSNPYKKIAELHNEGLTHLIKKLSSKTKAGLSREQIVETVCEYLNKASGQKSDIVKALNYSALIHLLNLKESNYIEDLQKLDLSKEAKEIIKELLDNNSSESGESLEKIIELEKRVFSLNLNERDKSIVLFTLAIADASIKYWEKDKNESNSLWRKTFGKIKLIPWESDVKGGIKAMANPTIDVIFDDVVIKPVIIAFKVIGNAIVASALDYTSEAKKKKSEDEQKKITEARQELLRKNSKKYNLPPENKE